VRTSARPAEASGEQRRAVIRHDVVEGQSARAGLREIIAEPSGQRLVHIRDGAGRRRREEARRRVIEKIDRVLQLLENIFLALPVRVTSATAQSVVLGP